MGFLLAVIGSAFALGLVGSLHCAGMCGPLMMACMGAGRTANGGTPTGMRPPLLYQAGRISTYMVLGALFGTFGAGLSLLGSQAQFSILAGAVLIIMGLFGRRLEAHIPIAGVLAKAYQKLGNRWGSWAPFGFGLINGIVPCGLVYAALAASLATGHPALGILFMGVFGVATSPGLLAVSWLAGRNRSLSAKLFPIVSLLAGGFLIYRGLYAHLPNDWVTYLALHPSLQCHG